MKAELKPEELRIGNWVKWPNEKEPNEVQWELGHWLGIHEKNYGYPVGIELSEEWLKKAGFNKNHKLILPDRGAFESYLIADSGEQRIQICRTGYWAYDPEIMYVHQLQNLYYALTGNELIFNHG